MATKKAFAQQCREYLEAKWNSVVKNMNAGEMKDVLGPDWAACIRECLTSRMKTYHYVLPTQLLCKCVNPKLDCHSLQTAYGGPGAFDARSIAHDVIVPFDQKNHRVLGGSTEPYVNNPLRCPGVTGVYREQQKNKQDWDKLVSVLDAVESHKKPREFASKAFRQVLIETYRLLAGATVLYPTPNRVSLAQTTTLISDFVRQKSGGERLEAVCAALFRAISSEMGIFDDVRRSKVNAADAASGMGADIECYLNKQLVLLVEVKDRSLTLTQLDAKLDIARSRKISELLFLAENGVPRDEKAATKDRIAREFASGQNVYVSSFSDFSAGILILLGERGRVAFLSFVGEELDRASAAIEHRQAWSDLLRSV